MILFPNVFIRLCINRVYANPLEVVVQLEFVTYVTSNIIR